ncbi:MAG TPA: T9SS type A sorting domain-containing protein [Vicingaceae bacterium]
MKKINLSICAFIVYLCIVQIKAQTVFEKSIYSQYNTGDVVNQDILVSQLNNNGNIITSGHYHYNQNDALGAIFYAILSDHDTNGSRQFTYSYVANDSDTLKLNTKVYSTVEYDGGYIMVGTVFNNSNYSSSVNGGGDLLIIKCNASGNVLNHKIVDIGGNDIGKAIKKMGSNSDFVLCGKSSYTDGSAAGFVMKIDVNLNIVWNRTVDSRIISSNSTNNYFNDIIYDGSNVWAVGEMKEVSGSRWFGLVVKLNSSGTFQTSRRLGYVSVNVFFNHVELDGNNLIMTGNQQKVLLFGGTTDQMVAIQYDKSTQTVVKDLRLGSNTSIGYDILKSGIGGSTNYYVVGHEKQSANPKVGVLHVLNSSFQATKKVIYQYNYDTELLALDTFSLGSCNYLTMSGYVGSSTPFSKGYFLKTDQFGFTSCEDTATIDTLSLILLANTLNDSVDTNYSYFTNAIFRDTLTDSLLCIDTLSYCSNNPIQKNRMINKENIDLELKEGNIYPNPIKQGDILNVSFNNTDLLINRITIVNSLGQTLINNQNILSKNLSIETNKLGKGVYFIYIESSNPSNRKAFTIKKMKLIVQ